MLLLWLVASAVAACESRLAEPALREQSAMSSGRLSLAFQLADGVDVAEVAYTIKREDGYRSQGAIPLLSSDDTFRALLTLPSASAYSLALQATTSEAAMCTGHARFDIWAERRTAVNVLMHCPSMRGLGSADLSGMFNVCPSVESVLVLPDQAVVGESVELSGTGSDPDDDRSQLHYLWTTTAGVLSDDTNAMTSLRCTEPGVAVVRVTISDGDSECDANSPVFEVTCIDTTDAMGMGGAPATINTDVDVDAGSTSDDADGGAVQIAPCGRACSPGAQQRNVAKLTRGSHSATP
jgi:hypothetical protein